ncbi:hypothetical protein AGLY_018157 [Aphis glycines]|uniref:Reverse transcriptase domain-containing protein n=1 Tax=Aphis glycines TaxID=307491 RepID=A0A6G0SSS3_APHGL|nr:hypothetical protein AGLY_018157 [Aphis glycines]
MQSNQLERAAQISESSDSSPDIISKDNKSIPGSFSGITKDNLRLYDNLNTSKSSFLNRTESILENANTTYQNLQKEKPETYQNTFKDLNTDNTSNNIYEKLIFNQTENSENKEGQLINLNKSTNNFNSNETSETTIFDDNSTIIITNKQTNDNLNSDVHSISLNKTTQKMNDKILMIRPDHFSGNEDVRKYFKQYEKAADVNGWKDEDKEFLDEFQPIGYDTILKARLETRRQGDTESIMSFVTEIENICRQLNKNMNEDEICTYILKGLKETVLHAISLHDNKLSDYTEILNEHVSQLNQKTREKGKEIDELKRQLIERDREYKREINQLRENIQQINITGRKNKSVNFDDEEINNRHNNNNYNYNEDRGRSYRTETNYRGQRREYRDKSPYPERFNYRSRESSRNRQYGRDRSLSRERYYYNNIQNETNTNQDYERKPSYKYIQKNYEHRDNSRDREPNINTNNGRGYRNRSHSRDQDNNREYNYSNRHQYSREHSREKIPERYRGDRYSKEAERIICYRCDEKGDNINNIKMDKIWAEHNGPPTILYKTEEVDKMPPKILTNIKIETNIGALDEESVIHPVDCLSTVIGTTEYYTKKDNLLTINKTNNDVCDNQSTIIKISKDLTNEQAEKAKVLIRKFQHLFTSEQLDLNYARVEEYEVKLSSKDPVFQAPYRVSPKQREKLKKIINEMINADIIEPSKSSYAALVFLIPKKQKGEYRFLVDFRKLNEQTINDRHPIPRSQDIFRDLEGAKYFSTVYMVQGYFQIPVRQEDREKLAFITDFGLFQFKRIPQGWKNSAPIFQRTINQIFSEYLYRSIVAYLDDICCFAD